jgi:1,4-alpha-glucan branching enzyme
MTTKKNGVSADKSNNVPPDKLGAKTNDSKTEVVQSPPDTPSILTDFDRYLLGEGNHWRSYEKLGAHVCEIDGVKGVNFIVWAPNAQAVSVVGDFNDWNPEANPMLNRIPSGFWELFVPGIGEWEKYKYSVRSFDNVIEKSDPVGFYAEMPPHTASVVYDLDKYKWQDEAWMKNREQFDWISDPISVYEVHLGSWRRPGDKPDGWLTYKDTARELVAYVKEMGYTHVELMPVAEHPLSQSWGYQVIGYFSITARYGTPDEFMYLVDLCHQNGIGVIVDWVPAHFPRVGQGLRRFDGTALYEHEDPRLGEHRDWGTLIFNYGRNEVRNFLISNAIFLFDKYHVDGIRVDAVASMLYLDYSRSEGEWIPNEFGGRENIKAIEFLKLMNEQVHLQFPNVLTIAEESTSWPGVSRPTYCGGLGFSMKWNMGWMNDTLRYMRHDPVHRKYHHDELTFSLIYAFHENFVLPISHDEVVHGKGSVMHQMPGDLWQKFANARLLYSYMWTHPGKKLLFMGNDFGQWNEWDFDESLQWHLLQWESHQGLQRCIAALNRMYVNEPALHEYDFDGRGFEWIDCHNWELSTFAYVRKAKNWEDFLLILCNFTPVPRSMRVGIFKKGLYREIFSSDSPEYGGSNTGNGIINGDGIYAEEIPSHGHPYSLNLYFPPLAVSVIKPVR